jgi:hypothetical protein
LFACHPGAVELFFNLHGLPAAPQLALAAAGDNKLRSALLATVSLSSLTCHPDILSLDKLRLTCVDFRSGFETTSSN